MKNVKRGNLNQGGLNKRLVDELRSILFITSGMLSLKGQVQIFLLKMTYSISFLII